VVFTQEAIVVEDEALLAAVESKWQYWQHRKHLTRLWNSIPLQTANNHSSHGYEEKNFLTAKYGNTRTLKPLYRF
jgi:hypothetical protein